MVFLSHAHVLQSFMEGCNSYIVTESILVVSLTYLFTAVTRFKEIQSLFFFKVCSMLWNGPTYLPRLVFYMDLAQYCFESAFALMQICFL